MVGVAFCPQDILSVKAVGFIFCHGFPNSIVESGKPRQKWEIRVLWIGPALTHGAIDIPPRWGGSWRFMRIY